MVNPFIVQKGEAMAGRGRPPITEEVKIEVVKIHDRHPSFSPRDIEKMWPYFVPESLKDKSPGHSKINEIVNEADANKEKMGTEKIWSSASLNEEPITPEAIHFLMWVQTYRKIFDSKPLTIREAKWFNRLLGIREEFSYPPDINNEELGKDWFIPNVIATWAQIYAYKEKIDILAGNKESDYSDLDEYILTGHLISIDDYNYDWELGAEAIVGKELASKVLPGGLDPNVLLQYLPAKCPLCGRPHISPVSDIKYKFDVLGLKEGLMATNTEAKYIDHGLTIWKSDYFLSSAIDENILLEIAILHHSLGEPADMSDCSKLLYCIGVAATLIKVVFRRRLKKLPYIDRIKLLILMRAWAKKHPNVKSAMIKPQIKKILDKVEKESAERKTTNGVEQSSKAAESIQK
jgi:hypothetical protein